MKAPIILSHSTGVSPRQVHLPVVGSRPNGEEHLQHFFNETSPLPIFCLPGFNTGKSVIGILWSSKVDYVTWFGANLEYIYGIQMLPFTPATELFLDDTDWVSESYEYLKTTNPNQEWKAFILSFLAIINKPQAWNEVQQLTSWDGGNSRTNTYYWVATRTNSKTNGGGGGGSNDDMDPHESKSEIIIALVVSCAIVGLVLLLVAIVGLPYIRKRNRRNTHYLAL
mmetsp:Transcript_23820/g.26429  ORF Transcript_23820/g.26429 Transcript_23820/m.26429 type:complete len:225 (+) Transcript_23820:248-922(+)